MQLPVVGDVFEGRYRIVGTLGEGGFGTVLRAVDPADRHVALKILKPDDRDGYTRGTHARFNREVVLMARLRDPHTVTLFNYGVSASGLLYMIFEFVPGRDLNEVLADTGTLGPDAVEHILRQLLQALREAHEAGLIHRDLKPENIRVRTERGDPLRITLLDFGIARGTDHGSPSVTKTGELIGTPRYMSVEQLLGKPLSPASDLYSLGMVAIELLAGAEALSGESIGEQLARVRSPQGVPIPDVPGSGPLLAVIRKMTATEPEHRYATASAVVSALDAIHAPRPNRPLQSPHHGDARATGDRKFVMAAVSVICVALVVALGLFMRANEDRPAPRVERTPPPTLQTTSPPALAHPEPADTAVDADVDTGPSTDWVGFSDGVRSGGCDSPHAAGFAEVDGGYRYVPAGYDPAYPHPLLVVVHSDQESPGQLFAASALEQLSNDERLVVLLPLDTSLDGRVPRQAWRAEEDVDVIRGMVARSHGELCVDRARTFLVSNGDGGRAVMLLLREKEREFAVAAAVFNSYRSFRGEGDSHPFAAGLPRPVPVAFVHPQRSTMYPSAGGAPHVTAREMMSIAENDALWRQQRRCEPDGRVVFDDDLGTCLGYTCKAGAFESCEIAGGGGWPGTGDVYHAMELDPPPSRFPIETYLWQFLRDAPPSP